MDAAERLLAADSARIAGGVGSSGAAAQSLEVPSGRTDADPELGLFLRRGAIEVALGYGDFLGGLEELKALRLKERRWHMKSKVFRASSATTLSDAICFCALDFGRLFRTRYSAWSYWTATETP